MLRIFIKCFLIASLAVLISACSSGLTTGSVERMLDKMDVAAAAQNIEGVADILSEDVDITLHLSAAGVRQTLTFSKETYIEMTQLGFDLSENYEYSRSNTIINIDGDKAIVSADTTETMTVQGEDVSGQTSSETTIELVDGVPLVTKIIAYTDM